MYESMDPIWENIFITLGMICFMSIVLLLLFGLPQVPDLIQERKFNKRQEERDRIKEIVKEINHEQKEESK